MRRNNREFKFSELQSLSMWFDPCVPEVYPKHKQAINTITGTNGLMGYM